MDDISAELRDPSLTALLKGNRHFHMMTILSSQYYFDMMPAACQQIDYYCVFAGIIEEKLRRLYKDADLSIDYETFEDLYKDSTSEKYGWLYIGARNGEFRDKFSKKYNIE